MDIAEKMASIPNAPKRWLDLNHFQTKFDSVEIREFLNMLTLERAIIVVADTFYRTVDQSSFDRTDKWFGTRWKVATDPYEYMPIDDISKKLYFPPVNPYFTSDLSLITIKSENENAVKIFHKNSDSTKSTLYSKPDFEFNMPKTVIRILIRCENFLQGFTEQSSFLTQDLKYAFYHVLPEFLKQSLTEKIYDAGLASLDFTVTPKNRGLVLTFYGITSTLEGFMMEILRFLKSPENWANIHFSNSRIALISSIQNDIMNSRVSATVVRLDYLYPGEASDLGIWRGMSQPDFNLNNLKRFVDEMVRYASIDMLVQGNTNTEFSNRLFGQVSEMLNVGDGYYTSNDGQILVRRLENVINEEKLAIRSFNTYTEDNHMIEKYYQYGELERTGWLMVALFVKIIQEPVFNQLRTKKQLGYYVGANMKDSDGVIGFSIRVQSSVENFSVEQIQQGIDEFEQNVASLISENLSVDEFNRYRESAILAKSSPDRNLLDQFERNWYEIFRKLYDLKDTGDGQSREYNFTRRETDIEFYKNLSIEDFRDFVMQFLIDCRVLNVQVHGNDMSVRNQTVGADGQFEFMNDSDVQSMQGPSPEFIYQMK